MLLLFAVSQDGNIQAINTDSIPEEERKSRCQGGLAHILDTYKESRIDFSQTDETGKLKLYLIINDGLKREEPFKVLPAYKCPTTPPIYIHEGHLVILKDHTSFPPSIKFQSYNMRISDEINEGKSARTGTTVDVD